MRTEVEAASHVGRKRSNNEDAFLADAALGVCVVADGLGGRTGGEVASRVAVDAIREYFASANGPAPLPARLYASIVAANRAIAARVRAEPALAGMATTLVAVLIDGARVVFAHVGDCRAYLYREKSLQQLTRDHSWVAEQIREGLLSEQEARVHPWRSVVTRAMSGSTDLAVDVDEMMARTGDRLVLCSDGLHGVLADPDIVEVLTRRREHELGAACWDLVNRANERGGPDNITVALVGFG